VVSGGALVIGLLLLSGGGSGVAVLDGVALGATGSSLSLLPLLGLVSLGSLDSSLVPLAAFDGSLLSLGALSGWCLPIDACSGRLLGASAVRDAGLVVNHAECLDLLHAGAVFVGTLGNHSDGLDR
jgi:hypothetical protein